MVEPIAPQNSDFDKLPNEKQEAALNFLAITESEKIDIALQYLEMCNFNLDQAITLYLDHQQQPQQILNQPNQRQPQTAPSNLNNQEEQEILNYQNYLIQKSQEEYNNSGLFHGIKTIITGLGGIISNSFSYFYSFSYYSKMFHNNLLIAPLAIRNPYPGGEEFYGYLKRELSFNFSQTYTFQMGELEENLNEAHNNKQPLIVFIFTLSEPLIDIQMRFLKEQSLIPFMVFFGDYVIYILQNQKYRILGLLSNSDELQQISSEVPLQKWPCLAIFRKNLYERRELISLIEINEQTYDVENILNQLKQSLLSHQQLQRKETKITQIAHKRLIRARQQQQQMFNQILQNDFYEFNPQRQPHPQEQEQRRIQFEQDRLLREQQEEELRQLQRQQIEKQELDRIQIENQRKKAEEAEKQKELEIKKKEERLSLLKTKRQELPTEPSDDNPDAFIFQFRMPDGQRYFWKILSTYNITKLFEFIDCHEEINKNYYELIQKFDLIQTIPFLSLQDKKDMLIQEVFQDSRQEILYIKTI